MPAYTGITSWGQSHIAELLSGLQKSFPDYFKANTPITFSGEDKGDMLGDYTSPKAQRWNRGGEVGAKVYLGGGNGLDDRTLADVILHELMHARTDAAEERLGPELVARQNAALYPVGRSVRGNLAWSKSDPYGVPESSAGDAFFARAAELGFPSMDAKRQSSNELTATLVPAMDRGLNYDPKAAQLHREFPAQTDAMYFQNRYPGVRAGRHWAAAVTPWQRLVQAVMGPREVTEGGDPYAGQR